MQDSALMQKPMLVRYGFNIRTKTGQRVDNIQIMAATSGEAERRLRQMYVQCEIIERREHSVARRPDAATAARRAPHAPLILARPKSGTH